MRLVRLPRAIKYLAFLATATALLLLLAEGGLRLFAGRPKGLFDLTPKDGAALYYPNARIPVTLMPIPYVVETNHLGFRGPEFDDRKPEGVIRIAALGDSVTDGFMVDNPDTYPVLLQQALCARGFPAEVINASRGGATIDREYAILRRLCAPLQPSVVVLTFVGNDIYEMGFKTPEEMIAIATAPPAPPALSLRALFVRTALGEWCLDTLLKSRFSKYRAQERNGVTPTPEDRYRIPGALDYEENVAEALESLQRLKLHYAEYSPELRARVEAYLAVLEDMHRWCGQNNIQLVFALFPSYVQTYAPEIPAPIYDHLRQAVPELGIPFIDLAIAFRAEDRNVPLYLAPLDYHPTPRGNAVLAEAIAQFLAQEILPEIAEKDASGSGEGPRK